MSWRAALAPVAASRRIDRPESRRDRARAARRRANAGAAGSERRARGLLLLGLARSARAAAPHRRLRRAADPAPRHRRRDGHPLPRSHRRPGAQAEALIDNLLAFSRMGRVPLERHDVDVQTMVEEVVADLTSEQVARDVKWTIDRAPARGRRPGDAARRLDEPARATRSSTPQSRAVAEVQVGTSRRERPDLLLRARQRRRLRRALRRQTLRRVPATPSRRRSSRAPGSASRRCGASSRATRGRTGGEGVVDRGATFWFSLPDPVGGIACPIPA